MRKIGGVCKKQTPKLYSATSPPHRHKINLLLHWLKIKRLNHMDSDLVDTVQFTGGIKFWTEKFK